LLLARSGARHKEAGQQQAKDDFGFRILDSGLPAWEIQERKRWTGNSKIETGNSKIETRNSRGVDLNIVETYRFFSAGDRQE
jgi:hypothetical protein